MKRSLISLVMAILLLPFVPAVRAEEETVARDISAEAEYYSWDTADTGLLTDKDEATFATIGYAGSLTINSKEPVAGLYIKFYLKNEIIALKANGKEVNCGDRGYIHEYVDVAELVGEATEIVLTFSRGAELCEIELYTAGTLPEDVQVWEAPVDRADLVLFSSHNDDEHLFFAGVLPYALAYGAKVQVVYFCDHSAIPVRVHEQLNGLWAIGIRNYPVMGAFPDLYSESKEWGETVFENAGYTREDFIEWQVENLRRFKPQVAVGHDAAGEYGHGTHIINSETLREAIPIAADPEQYPYLTASYGAWDTPKVYIHLWEENEIVMDFDSPLEYYGGKSAYEISRVGYGEHYTQHWTWFTDWLIGTDEEPITKASQIEEYNPCRYGLWRSTVGADTKADFFDNIVLYSVQEEEAAHAATSSDEETTTPPPPVTTPTDTDGDDGEFSPIWLVAIVGAAAVITAIILMIRKSKSPPPPPTRAQSQARRLREVREMTPSPDAEAQNLRDVRAKLAQTEDETYGGGRRVSPSEGSRSASQAQRLREARAAVPPARPSSGARPTSSERTAGNSAHPANGGRPANAGVQPTQNPAQSAGNGARPVSGGVRTVQSPSQSAENSVRPANGGARPAQSPARPVGNGARPASNGVRTAQSPSQSAENSVRPVGGGAQSVQNPARLAGNGTQPVSGGGRPAQSPSQSAENSVRPANDGAQSVQNPARLAGNGTQSVSGGVRTAQSPMQSAENSVRPANDDVQSVQNPARLAGNGVRPVSGSARPASKPAPTKPSDKIY